VAQVKATIDFAGTLRTEPAPGEVNQALLERFRAWSRR
jgi:hypothetical protein